MFCGARARARPEDIEGVYAHLFFVLLSVFELDSPSDVVQNGGRRGRQFSYVLWECMLKISYVRSCGGVCPLLFVPIGAYDHCVTYDVRMCLLLELRLAFSVVWRSPP